MSRIGRLPISLPEGVKVTVEDRAIQVEGPKGKLRAELPQGIEARMEGNALKILRGIASGGDGNG
uniref:50S ribosomal protein L6, large subunit ribosomal protein L6 n=1 Tax=uncultured delta proteobacterium Rifle_16ft_4_minimus_1997 TaxID=1665176 RepID=A0A0H4T1R1_9DELT|nr:50S ribosomal protein L6, large subunit ribosomal protein L6 [uncultured delta proteobacterium Rifle_16ft_4_minimus_1997]